MERARWKAFFTQRQDHNLRLNPGLAPANIRAVLRKSENDISGVTLPTHLNGPNPLQLAGGLVTSECNYPTLPEMGTCCCVMRQYRETVDGLS